MKAILTIYNSRRDMYGNVYYAVSLHDWDADPTPGTPRNGTISADNVSTRDCREKLDWYIERQELPIREYNRMVKGWPYLGCTWPDIKAKLTRVPRWTYISDSCGYMLYHDGKAQGGARTTGTATHTSDGRRRSWQARRADTRENAATAQRLCDQYNSEGKQP